MDYNLDIRNILVLIVTVLNFAIGFLIYTRDKKNSTNIAFFFFALIVGFWGVSMVFFRSATGIEIGEFFARELYFWASLIPLSFIYFIYTFPTKESTLNFWQKYLLPVPAFIIVFFSLKANFLIETVTFVNSGENQIIFNKLYHTLYIIYMVGYFNYAYLLLFKKFLKKEKGTQRSQIGYVIIGTLLTTLIGTGTNLLGPYFGYFELNWFGQVGLIAMISTIAYAILKYQLFNVKLIVVELAIILLNLFLFINVFTFHSKSDFVLNTSVLAFIFIFSIFLMRGIYKDIRDRERILALVKDMEVANERLRMMEGQKTEFVSIASHQLRTPLTIIKGYASMILEGTFGSLNDSARVAMEKLYKSSEKIVALVEDLLTVSRIEQGRMTLNFETINFKDFVQRSLSEIEDMSRDAKIDFSFTAEEDREFLVSIDEKKFKQVLVHIFENAIKYNVQFGSVRVTMASDSLTRKMRLTISDTGVGMTPSQIASIFERFNMNAKIEVESGVQSLDIQAAKEEEDAESAMMEKRTPGIGLYIAEEIIEAHHGTIRIESEGTDRGTTVIVELPMVVEVA